MSRTLLRLRVATGDPLLVRAGRRLVPTPYALALRDRVHAATDDARAVLRPALGTLDLLSLDRVFILRANEGFVEAFAARLVTTLAEAAPGVRLRFAGRRSGRATPSLRTAPSTAPHDNNRQRLHLTKAKQCLDEAGHL